MEGKRFVEALQRKHAWLGEARSHAYIASFVLSDDGRDRSDKLTFWRTYGSDGKGCSVTLKRMPTPVYRVRYGEGAFEDAHCRIDPVLAALEPVLEMLNDDSQEARWLRHSLVTTIWRALGGIPYLYKDDAYTDEHECRVVVPAHTLSREDQRNIVIEPYPTKPNGKWRHYYKDDALAAEKIFDSDCTIVLGPAVRYRDNVAYCLERMLRDGQGYGANVVVSTIPYRSQNEHE
ncbi:MAG: hypothetical protein F4Y07_05075 [Gemmatimonadetes bacterium]|nr:hypothetical protein [Gemmatimonadota bacterium]